MACSIFSRLLLPGLIGFHKIGFQKDGTGDHPEKSGDHHQQQEHAQDQQPGLPPGSRRFSSMPGSFATRFHRNNSSRAPARLEGCNKRPRRLTTFRPQRGWEHQIFLFQPRHWPRQNRFPGTLVCHPRDVTNAAYQFYTFCGHE